MSNASEGAPQRADQRQHEAAVHAELLAARKRPHGLSPHYIAQCPVLCDLLGNGDPHVAHVALTHKALKALESEDDAMAIEAACYSLGLASSADTHLDRLVEFGNKYFLEQRQVRRYSDRGVEQLARLIASNWTIQTVPEASLVFIGTGEGSVALAITLRRQWHVHMREPKLSEWSSGTAEPSPLRLEWTPEPPAVDRETWVTRKLNKPLVLAPKEATTFRFVWPGETWPKFTVLLTGATRGTMTRVETLGAVCAVTVSSDLQPPLSP